MWAISSFSVLHWIFFCNNVTVLTSPWHVFHFSGCSARYTCCTGHYWVQPHLVRCWACWRGFPERVDMFRDDCVLCFAAVCLQCWTLQWRSWKKTENEKEWLMLEVDLIKIYWGLSYLRQRNLKLPFGKSCI